MAYSTSRHASRVDNQKLRKMKFLEEMEKVIPWDKLVREVEQRYSTSKVGRPKLWTLLMLKIYFLQQRYNLSDPWMEEDIYDRVTFQKFLDIDIAFDQVPDESSILRFRHFLEEHKLQERFFKIINDVLGEQWILLKEWTTVDATIIHASSSTKNKDKKRDPEMKSTFKGKNAYFWMKAHAWTDKDTWLIHSLAFTSANVHDLVPLEKLLHGEEKVIYGDSAYMSIENRKNFYRKGVSYRACKRSTRYRKIDQLDKWMNQLFSKVRAKWEHAFGVIKHQWHHRRVRYRWLFKNSMQWYMLAWLSNLYMSRKKLLAT